MLYGCIGRHHRGLIEQFQDGEKLIFETRFGQQLAGGRSEVQAQRRF